MTIEALLKQYIDENQKINSILVDSTFFYQQTVDKDSKQYEYGLHAAMVEHCFISQFLLWERLLEQTFIEYLCGEKDLKGNNNKTYALPTDSKHAYSIIKGTRIYPDWTNLEEVNKLADIYFENRGTFACLHPIPLEFNNIKTIRNRISHVSESSNDAFNRLLAKTIFKTGIPVAEFLLTMKDKKTSYYSFYTETMFNYAEAICNK